MAAQDVDLLLVRVVDLAHVVAALGENLHSFDQLQLLPAMDGTCPSVLCISSPRRSLPEEQTSLTWPSSRLQILMSPLAGTQLRLVLRLLISAFANSSFQHPVRKSHHLRLTAPRSDRLIVEQHAWAQRTFLHVASPSGLIPSMMILNLLLRHIIVGRGVVVIFLGAAKVWSNFALALYSGRLWCGVQAQHSLTSRLWRILMIFRLT